MLYKIPPVVFVLTMLSCAASGCARALPAVTYEPTRANDYRVLETVLLAWNARDDLPDLTGEQREKFLGVLVHDPVDGDGFRNR